MYKWFLNRGPNCTTQNHNTQGRPNGHLRSHPTQSPRARDTHPLDQRSQLTVEPPDGLGGGVIINAKVFRDRVHGNATSAHLSRVRSDPLVHRHRGRDQTRSTSTDSQAKVRMFSCRVHHSNPPVFSSLETVRKVEPGSEKKSDDANEHPSVSPTRRSWPQWAADEPVSTHPRCAYQRMR